MLLGRFLGPGFLLAGLVALAVAVARNEASVALVFVVPVVIGSGPLAFLGVLTGLLSLTTAYRLHQWDRPVVGSSLTPAPVLGTGS